MECLYLLSPDDPLKQYNKYGFLYGCTKNFCEDDIKFFKDRVKTGYVFEKCCLTKSCPFWKE